MTPEQDQEAWAWSEDLALYAVVLVVLCAEPMIDWLMRLFA